MTGNTSGGDETTPYIDSSVLSAAFAESRGRYRLCLKLAEGGMATIYLAIFRGTDGLQRPVVVKRVHPHLAKRLEYVEMFFDEAQLAAMVGHPAVCALYDFGRSQDTYFLSMEYLVGETFEKITSAIRDRNEAADLTRMANYVARMFTDIAEGLHAVHEARDAEGQLLDIVHRDVTPQNLFALYDGSVRLTDFGIARSRDRLHDTRTGVLKGKLSYMSPEQLSHENIDRRSDVWSLGVVLWETLTQQRLFHHDSASTTVEAVRRDPIRSPSTQSPFVPAELDKVVERALQRDVSKRYQTAREMALDLEAFLSARKDCVPAADLAHWLENLFPGAASERRALVQQARGMVNESMAPPPITRLLPLAALEPEPATIPKIVVPVASAPSEKPVPPVPRPVTSVIIPWREPAVIFLGLGILLLAFAACLYLMTAHA